MTGQNSCRSELRLGTLLATVILCCLLRVSAMASPEIEVVPGLQGFGVTTPAGRGGKVLRVTNLSNSGEGSLRHAVAYEGSRTIIFEVAGQIILSSDIKILNPYLTIAGQTAPTPGITLRGAGIKIYTHDVLIQHLRIRVGDSVAGPLFDRRDGIGIRGLREDTVAASRIVIDHCSISWAMDEGVDTWFPGVNNVTVNASIISENLSSSHHSKGEHSSGMLIGDASKFIMVSQNLFAHNMRRNPLVKGAATAIVLDNLIYNPGASSVAVTDPEGSGPSLVSLLGNLVIPGPDTKSHVGVLRVNDTVSQGIRVFVKNNEYLGDTGSVSLYDIGSTPRASSPPIWIDGIKSVGAWGLVKVLRDVGARPSDRDAVDQRIINEVITATGRIINIQDDVGGWEDVASAQRTLQLPTNPHADDDNDGYTNLEEWLHEMANNLETGKYLKH